MLRSVQPVQPVQCELGRCTEGGRGPGWAGGGPQLGGGAMSAGLGVQVGSTIMSTTIPLPPQHGGVPRVPGGGAGLGV